MDALKFNLPPGVNFILVVVVVVVVAGEAPPLSCHRILIDSVFKSAVDCFGRRFSPFAGRGSVNTLL